MLAALLLGVLVLGGAAARADTLQTTAIAVQPSADGGAEVAVPGSPPVRLSPVTTAALDAVLAQGTPDAAERALRQILATLPESQPRRRQALRAYARWRAADDIGRDLGAPPEGDALDGARSLAAGLPETAAGLPETAGPTAGPIPARNQAAIRAFAEETGPAPTRPGDDPSARQPRDTQARDTQAKGTLAKGTLAKGTLAKSTLTSGNTGGVAGQADPGNLNTGGIAGQGGLNTGGVAGQADPGNLNTGGIAGQGGLNAGGVAGQADPGNLNTGGIAGQGGLNAGGIAGQAGDVTGSGQAGDVTGSGQIFTPSPGTSIVGPQPIASPANPFVFP